MGESPRMRYEEALVAFARGDDDEALAAVESALAHAPGTKLGASLQELRGRIVGWHEAPLRAYELILTEVGELEAAQQREAVSMLIEASLCAADAGEPSAAHAAADRAVALARRAAPDLLPAARLSRDLIDPSTARSTRDARAVVAAVVDLDRRQLLESWESLHRAITALFWFGDHERARDVLETVVARGRAYGFRALLPLTLDTLAALDFRTGRWASADARSNEALRIARELRQTSMIASSLTTLAGIASARGDGAATRTYADEALAHGAAYIHIEAWARTALASYALSAGRPEDTIAELERVVGESRPDPAAVPWVHELTEAYVRVRRFDDAAEIVERVVSRIETLPRPILRATAAHCRGLVAEPRAFDAHFLEALRWHEKAGSPFAQARTRLAYGQRLRRARRSPEARAQLELALAAFEQLGARLWAERARSELTERGRPRGGESPLNFLTVHERRVAALVARGATNKEAAAALFVSPKTVDYHLAGIYRKLGLRSRVELAALLAAGDINA